MYAQAQLKVEAEKKGQQRDTTENLDHRITEMLS